MLQPFHHNTINPYPGKGEIVVLFAGHSQTEPEHKVGPQVRDYHLVHYVVSGTGTFRCRGREYALTTGDSFFIAPSELVSYASDAAAPWQYRWVAFKGTQADELLARLGIGPHQPVASTAGRLVPLLFHRIERALHDADPSCDMRANGNMRLLFAEWMKASGTKTARKQEPDSEIDRQVEQAIRWLTLQYPEPISIEQMAGALGYHRTYLSKMFKQHTGMSPMNFLLKLRMERARTLLMEPLTIEQVASSVGFADSLYFSKQFRKWYGLSPSEYRHDTHHRERFDCP
ncbi:AraC family transcriptional regulator [Paenibacillus cymbidii]|uniref:AraC family transcriptional regulator n=1 Tax=Paenibacillus cymbidii TaxID=1639034 RepID=UPI00108009AF|nr:AraC family transcriptional regulator [Paenibacillus cymbidii]